jgi:4-hydroxy-3-methylbut-2-enyl diphosphate reductase
MDRKTVLFSQTTMDKPTYYLLKEELTKRIKELVLGSMEELAADFLAKDTICGQVFGREKKIREFAAENELIIFVAGRHSSNGKVLFEIVRSVNSRIQFIENVQELQTEWFEGIETVGITGATSTPQWLMEKVKEKIETMINLKNSKNNNQPSLINGHITH